MPNFNENNIGLTKFRQENVTEVPWKQKVADIFQDVVFRKPCASPGRHKE
jgi:hypothetical protein